VVRLTFYVSPVSLSCLLPFFWMYEVSGGVPRVEEQGWQGWQAPHGRAAQGHWHALVVGGWVGQSNQVALGLVRPH
jgi:hypothetical protein